MIDSNDIAYVSATELAGRIRRRELSPVEVVDAFIERIEHRNSSINAFVYTSFEEAKIAARNAEHAIMSHANVGPLHGVPTAIKDLFDFKPGWPATMGGIRALKDFKVDAYCIFAERMERAGAIILGKCNSPVMGFRGTCDNPLFGPSRNPFDTTRNTGGSSGGSAAAVADGLVPFAEGTDGGGSIRIPASWCGLYGYKASFGRVPSVVRPNAFGGTIPFLFEGPLTRTVADAALALNVLSGYDPRDPFSLDEQHDFRAALDRPIEGMRIAYSPDFGVYPVDGCVARVVEDAVRAFEEAGAQVQQIEIKLPFDQHELSDLWCRQIMLGNVDTLESFKRNGLDLLVDHRGDFPEGYLRWADEVYGMSISELSRDYAMRSVVYDAIQGLFETHDLLATPTLATLPVPNAKRAGDTVGRSDVEGVEVDELIGWCLTYFTNFTGHPSASIPAGLVDGLPVGMQLIGNRYGDADVLAASAAFERLRAWQETYQRCASRLV
ncbi:MAG: amidase [Nocardioidaceae bacterium]